MWSDGPPDGGSELWPNPIGGVACGHSEGPRVHVGNFLGGRIASLGRQDALRPVGHGLPRSVTSERSGDYDPAVDDVIDQLLANSRQFEQGFAAGNLPSRPARRLAIVSCMDSRIDLFALLGIRSGEAHVIRNAGGIVTEDVLRSLTLSRWLLGTQHIFVIQHTSCGLHQLAEEELKAKIESAGPEVPFPFGSFADLAKSVLHSVRGLRAHPLLAGSSVRGAIYNVDSGRLDEIRA